MRIAAWLARPQRLSAFFFSGELHRRGAGIVSAGQSRLFDQRSTSHPLLTLTLISAERYDGNSTAGTRAAPRAGNRNNTMILLALQRWSGRLRPRQPVSRESVQPRLSRNGANLRLLSVGDFAMKPFTGPRQSGAPLPQTLLKPVAESAHSVVHALVLADVTPGLLACRRQFGA